MPINFEANERAATALRLWRQRTPGLQKVLSRCCDGEGIHRSTFNDWVREKISVPSWAITELVRATGDIQLFIDATGASELGILCVPRKQGEAGDCLQAETLQVAATVGEVAEVVGRVTADGIIEPEEHKEVLRVCDKTERYIDSLRKTSAVKVAAVGR